MKNVMNILLTGTALVIFGAITIATLMNMMVSMPAAYENSEIWYQAAHAAWLKNLYMLGPVALMIVIIPKKYKVECLGWASMLGVGAFTFFGASVIFSAFCAGHYLMTLFWIWLTGVLVFATFLIAKIIVLAIKGELLDKEPAATVA